MSSDRVIDLRSDTLSTPTEAMRRAMALAEVGDDAYGEDPTVELLQQAVAERLGKPAALFMPSGTMANQVAIHLHTRPGDELLAEASSHATDLELGAAAALSGVQIRPVSGTAGVITADQLRPHLGPRRHFQARLRLLILENTHNMAGGRVCPLDTAVQVAEMARDAGLRTHLDGARLFNAVVASGHSAARYAAPFDSVMVCLSKGLSAPIGSLLAGNAELITEARRVRAMFGGGMRQVGVIAAAGLVALEHGVDRLADDHANARRLADGLLAGGRVALVGGRVDTNIVALDVTDSGSSAPAFAAAARERGVLCSITPAGAVRLVTYRNISSADIDETLRRLGPLTTAG